MTRNQTGDRPSRSLLFTAGALLASATLPGCPAEPADRGGADLRAPVADDLRPQAASEIDRPNFVFILGEAQGWPNTSVQQHEAIPESRSKIYQTPSLDRLAGQGAVFSDFYAPSPRCMPSRASYFTGKSPAQLHMTFIPEGGRDGDPMGQVVPPVPLVDMPTDAVTIASMLRARGYATAHYGKWHASKSVDPSRYGFDESDGPTANRGPENVDHPNPKQAYAITEHGMAFMAQQVSQGKPFYLQVSHYGGNDPIDSRPETLAAETARLAGRSAGEIAYAAVIRDMDTTIGMLLDKIDALGIGDRTYVYFSADHGAQGTNAPLTHGKGGVWEGGIRVPFLIRGPRIPAGSRSHARASQVDLLPTLAELAHVTAPRPAGLEGGSLLPLWTQGGGQVARQREEFVIHYPHYDKDPIGPASAILLGDYKLIRAYEDGALRLYNLRQDLSERNDLRAQMPELAADLDRRLSAYLTAVGAQLPGHL